MHMPRVTLYVPDELKGRMDAVGEAINWSAVAQAAFSEAVAVHNLRKDPTNMDELVARLRASKERIAERDLVTGREDGKEWATTSAELDELERINRYDDHHYTLDILCNLLDPNEEMDGSDWDNFFENLGHPRGTQPSELWVQGFMEGADEVYCGVADKL
jgi:hypothetical protein